METALIISRNSNMALTKIEKAIILANSSKRIEELSQEQLVDFVGMLMSESLMSLGHKNAYSDAKDIASAQMLLINSLSLYASTMTIDEIRMACQMGTNGELDAEGKIITFSPAGVMGWIRKFKERAQKVRFKELELQRIEEEKRKEIEIAQNNIQFLKKTLEESLQYVLNNNLVWVEFDDVAYQPAFQTLYTHVKEHLFLPTEGAWKFLISIRKEIKDQVQEFEKSWKQEDFRIFSETIEEESILRNNYFHMKAISIAKIRLYKEAIVEIAKQENCKEIITNIQNQVL